MKWISYMWGATVKIKVVLLGLATILGVSAFIAWLPDAADVTRIYLVDTDTGSSAAIKDYGSALFQMDIPTGMDQSLDQPLRELNDQLILINGADKTVPPSAAIDTQYLPIPIDQREKLGPKACSFVACVYYLKSFQEASEARRPFSDDPCSVSERDLFFLHDPLLFHRKFFNGSELDHGANISLVLGALKKYGAFVEADNGADDQAWKSKINNYYLLYSNEIKNLTLKRAEKRLIAKDNVKGVLKKFLSSGYPLIISLNNYHQLDTLMAARNKHGKWIPFTHTVMLTGYDDDRFIYLNSLGPDWGEQGFGEVDIDFLYENARKVYLPLDNRVDRITRVDAILNGIDQGRTMYLEGNGTGGLSINQPNHLNLSKLTVAELMDSPPLHIKVINHRKDHFIELHRRFPFTKEFQKPGEESFRPLVQAICSRISLSDGLRTWGKLAYFPEEGGLLVDYTFLDANGIALATLSHPIALKGTRFDDTVYISDKLLLSQVVSVRLDCVQPINTVGKPTFRANHTTMIYNLEETLKKVALPEEKYIGSLDELSLME